MGCECELGAQIEAGGAFGQAIIDVRKAGHVVGGISLCAVVGCVEVFGAIIHFQGLADRVRLVRKYAQAVNLLSIAGRQVGRGMTERVFVGKMLLQALFVARVFSAQLEAEPGAEVEEGVMELRGPFVRSATMRKAECALSNPLGATSGDESGGIDQPEMALLGELEICFHANEMRLGAMGRSVLLRDGLMAVVIEMIGIDVESAAGMAGFGRGVETQYPSRGGADECGAEGIVGVMPLRIVGIDLALPSAVFPGGVAGDKEDGGPANVVLWRGTIHHLGRADVTGRDPTEYGPKSLAGEGRLAAIDQNSQAGGAGQRKGITLIAHTGK